MELWCCTLSVVKWNLGCKKDERLEAIVDEDEDFSTDLPLTYQGIKSGVKKVNYSVLSSLVNINSHFLSVKWNAEFYCPSKTDLARLLSSSDTTSHNTNTSKHP
jgi:hypothetical protein